MANSDGCTFVPEDLLIEILTRLPVKSLLRFKCVCKYWYTLIKSPSFISQQYHLDNNPTHLVFHHRIHVNSKLSKTVFSLFPDESLTTHQNFDYPKMPMDLDGVVGPVNGLFLLQKMVGKLDLWNPVTRESRTLSELNPNFPNHIIRCVNALGFGSDPLTHDYKVILVQYYWDLILHPQEDMGNNLALFIRVIGVYNLATDSWNLLDPDSTKIPSNLFFRNASIYLNGHHYWLSAFDNSPTIIAFDMRNEVFREVQVPPQLTAGYLSLYNDDIALFSKPVETAPTNMWVMEVEGCWTKLFTIENLPELSCPLKLWNNNELFFENRSSDLVLYNISTRETRNIGIRGFHYSIFKYKESLVSVSSGSKKSERRGLYGIIRDLFIDKASTYLGLA